MIARTPIQMGKYTKSPVFKFQTVQISKRKQTSFYRGRKYSVTVTLVKICVLETRHSTTTLPKAPSTFLRRFTAAIAQP